MATRPSQSRPGPKSWPTSPTRTIWPRRRRVAHCEQDDCRGGAGAQGAVTISVSCSGTALPDFVVPANSPAGTVFRSYTGIAAGSTCTVTETGTAPPPVCWL